MLPRAMKLLPPLAVATLGKLMFVIKRLLRSTVESAQFRQ